jgi:hypothetical protein
VIDRGIKSVAPKDLTVQQCTIGLAFRVFELVANIVATTLRNPFLLNRRVSPRNVINERNLSQSVSWFAWLIFT